VLTLCKAGRTSEHSTNSQTHRLRSIAKIKDANLLARNCKWNSYTTTKPYKCAINYYIVAHRPVAKRQFFKQRLFLGKDSVKNVPMATNAHATIELLLKTGCFLCNPYRDVITRTVGAMSSVVGSIRQRATQWAEKLMNLHCWELLPNND
jgi:hypothetical protein